MNRQAIQAFTLIEMTIVLAIIGFLAGGIVVGSGMLNAGELRQLQTDSERYSRAIVQFRDKYNELPGDFSTAADVWGARDSGGDNNGIGADCTDLASSDERTCNGNGDSRIADDNATMYEMFRMWQHLGNEGFLDATMTGAKASTDADSVSVGENVPEATYGDAVGISLQYRDASSTEIYAPAMPAHLMLIGAQQSNAVNNAPALTVREAWQFDNKIDDGKPGSGNVVSFTNTAMSSCTTSDDADDAEYNKIDESSQPKCVVLTVEDF